MSPETHLDNEELSLAVVEPDRLSGSARDHLEACPRCQEEWSRLKQDLEGLGRKAKAATPVPPRRAALPLEEKRTRTGPAWLMPLAAGFVAAAVLVWSLWLGPLDREPGARGHDLYRMAALEAGTVVADLGLTDEEVFSPFHLYVLGQGGPSLDQDFLDFISPPAAETYSLLDLGAKPC